MSRTTIEPLRSLSSVLPIDTSNPTVDELARLKAGFCELLLGENCVEVGTGDGRVHDSKWDHDIGFIVDQLVPRRKVYERESGIFITVVRVLQIVSLRCEVDARGEVCCWLYSHSNDEV